MAPNWVWLQHELPWLGHGFIHAVSDKHVGETADALGRLGFTVVSMQPTSPSEFHEALAGALNFPDYYGRNWDATHDVFSDINLPHPFALIWRDAETIAASDPKLFGEATSVLTREFVDLGSHGIQAELFITGNGPAFRDPPIPT